MKRLVFFVSLLFFLIQPHGRSKMWVCQTTSSSKTASDQRVVSLPPLVFSVLRDKRPVAYVRIRVSVQGEDDKSFEVLQKNTPLVYDAFLSELYVLYNLLWDLKETTITKASLTKRLDEVCKNIFKVDLVHDVFLDEVRVKKIALGVGPLMGPDALPPQTMKT